MAWESYASWASLVESGLLDMEDMIPMTIPQVALRSILWMEAVATLGMGLYRIAQRGTPRR